tara:strand:- start:39236 stop:41236 length:2001 start_codon:yes stop_codon:yes gene_type:complete
MKRLAKVSNTPSPNLPVVGLLFIVIVQLLSHQMHTPLWLSAFVLILLAFKFIAYKNQVASVSFILRSILIISSSVTFIAYYKANFSVDMAASFLLLAGVLKLLEMEKHKDANIFIFSMIYLSAVSFLFEQGILHTLLQVISITICFYCLLVMQIYVDKNELSSFGIFKYHSKSMLKIVTISIPLVVILFLFFPRISPLWQMPIKTQTAKTGFSSEMSPGDVSKLARSSEPAFRVTFEGILPDKVNLYWRGLVLDQFDGRKWVRAAAQNGRVKPYKVDPGTLYETNNPSYQVMLEPHQQEWVFSLEGSVASSSNLIRSEMGIYRLKTEAIQATRYKMALNPKDKSKPLLSVPTAYSVNYAERTSSYKMQDLQLPSRQLNPKTQLYIKQLKERLQTDELLLRYLLNRFREEPFFYTLEPPALGKDFADEFLFETKTGFCEHYASSLAYMLRLAGIPARVLIGYQGGETNLQADYMLVSQYDAHAWVEVFIDGKGWLRVDPTAMVSPLRISEGSSRTLGDERAFLENSPFASAAMKYALVNWFRLRLDEINYQWQNIVVNYNQDQQQNFFIKTLGENSLLRIALFFVYIFISLFLLMLAYLWLKRLSAYSPAEKRYMIWLSFLSKFGLTRLPGETPRSFLDRIKRTKYKRLAALTEKKTQRLEEQQYRG